MGTTMRITTICQLAGFCAAAIALLTWTAGPYEVGRLATAAGDPSEPSRQSIALLEVVFALVAWLIVGWLVAVSVAGACSRLPGFAGRFSATVLAGVTPEVLARTLRLGVVAATGLGVAGPLSTTAALAATPSCADATEVPTLDRGPVTCLSTSTATDPASVPASPASVASAPAAGPRAHVVRPGESLWAIAASELQDATGRRPTAVSIADRWPQWWYANRETVGGNPALVHPGDVLRAPAPPVAAAPAGGLER